LTQRELHVALRTNATPRLRNPDRVLWVWFRRLWPSWRDHLLIVKPARSSAGTDLIGTRSGDNRLWGTERIRGELLKLGIVVSKRSIRRYRWRKPTPVGSQTWRTFLSNQLKGIWAADLLVVHTIGFRTLYVLFFIRHDRRELIPFNVTSSPTAAWVWQQLVESTAWGRQPKHLIHDRDAVYGGNFGARLASLGIASVRTPVRAPRANAIAERLVRALRSEALNHIIVFNERHLHAVLGEFVTYYNRDRPHRSLGLQSPLPRSPTALGKVVRRPVLGGLHHAYARAA
jgi:transposase InsO family protein